MLPKLSVNREACEELSEAATWYEQQRPGLGDALLSAVGQVLARVQASPNAGVPYHPTRDDPTELRLRRAPVSGFPYMVVYLVRDDEIRVLAFAHGHRRPGYWRQRR